MIQGRNSTIAFDRHSKTRAINFQNPMQGGEGRS